MSGRSGLVANALAIAAIIVLPSGPAAAASLAESSPTPVGDRAAAIGCLAEAIGHEAGNELEAGQQAVAEVILNRVAHRAFPKTVCGVVFQGAERRTGCQFTFTCDGARRRSLSSRTWERATRIAGQALDGLLPGTVGAATHYHADYVAPRWAPSLVRIRQLGTHIFYRFPGAAGPPSAAAPGAAPPQGSVQFSVWGLPAATLTARDGRIETRRD